MKKDNNSFKSFDSHEEGKISDNSNNSFFNQDEIEKHKDQLFKIRIEDTILRCGISKRDFYKRIGVSSAYWYRLSWGIDKIPAWLKTKLCEEFGKPFIDFFLIHETEKEVRGDENK